MDAGVLKCDTRVGGAIIALLQVNFMLVAALEPTLQVDPPKENNMP